LLGIVRCALNSSVPSGGVVADYRLDRCIRVVGIWVAIGIATILVIIARASIPYTLAGAIGSPGSTIRRGSVGRAAMNVAATIIGGVRAHGTEDFPFG
jgi:hypothetical protein